MYHFSSLFTYSKAERSDKTREAGLGRTCEKPMHIPSSVYSHAMLVSASLDEACRRRPTRVPMVLGNLCWYLSHPDCVPAQQHTAAQDSQPGSSQNHAQQHAQVSAQVAVILCLLVKMQLCFLCMYFLLILRTSVYMVVVTEAAQQCHGK